MSKLSTLLESYLAGPVALRRAVSDMSPEQLLARPVPGKWSTIEVVAHLADFEPILAERLKRIVALDRPTLLAADENLFAQRLGYQLRDVEEELRLIEVTRQQMARILGGLDDSVLGRVGVHSERGELTFERVLTSASNHIPHHLAFIKEKRQALGLSQV